MVVTRDDTTPKDPYVNGIVEWLRDTLNIDPKGSWRNLNLEENTEDKGGTMGRTLETGRVVGDESSAPSRRK